MQMGSFGLEAFEQLTNMIVVVVVVVVLETISVSYFTRPKEKIILDCCIYFLVQFLFSVSKHEVLQADR